MRKEFVRVLAVAAALQGAVLSQEAVAGQATPGFNNKIPESILTPDTVETRIGTLEFFDGIPNKKAAAALFANLDLNRGLQTLLSGMPASNFEAGRAGHIALGQIKANQAIIFDGLMDSNSLFLTGNAGTVYLTSFLDLERDGPTVIEIPAGTGPGIMVDSFTRNIIDMGPPGPHRGKAVNSLSCHLAMPRLTSRGSFRRVYIPSPVLAAMRSGSCCAGSSRMANRIFPANCSETVSRSIRLAQRLIRQRWNSSMARGRSSTPFTPPATSSTKNSTP